MRSSGAWAAMRQELPQVLTCCAVFFICVALSKPFPDSPFGDDFSYSHVAFRLAQTGQFHYTGWGSPSVVLQSVWAAIWIHVFGFSFNLLRAVTLPFSLAFTLMTYALGRKVGLSPNFALFGSLVVGTSPLFLPLASSFMTEPYACSLTLVCLYAACSSADAFDSIQARRWLWVVAVSGIAGGSDRQSVLVAPIVVIPYLLWKRRADRKFTFHAVLAYLVCLFSLVLIVKYFSPPYAPLNLSRPQLLALIRSKWLTTIRSVVSVLLVAVWLSLPAFTCTLKAWRRVKAWQIGLIALLSIAALSILRKGMLVPFIGGILPASDFFAAGMDTLRIKPLLAFRSVQYGLTFILLLFLAMWIYSASRKYIRMGIPRTSGIVLLLFTLAYVPLLFPGALTGFTYDRYALPLLPLVVILVLSSAQSATTEIPRLAYAAMIASAIYAVLFTHDYSASLQARATAARELEERGVPPTQISVGFERDGWTQVQIGGTIKTAMFGDDLAKYKFWFWLYAPVIQPDYVAVSTRLEDSVKQEILEVPYVAWTRPFLRKIVIVKQEDLPDDALYYYRIFQRAHRAR